jgi:hypothetical protein
MRFNQEIIMIPLLPSPPGMETLFEIPVSIKPACILSQLPTIPTKPPPLEVSIMKPVSLTRNFIAIKPVQEDHPQKEAAMTTAKDTPKVADMAEAPVSKVIKAEPALSKKVRTDRLARFISFNEGIPLNDAEGMISTVENNIREICNRGHKVQFGDGFFEKKEVSANVREFSPPPMAGSEAKPKKVLINAYSALKHTTSGAKELGVPMWECTEDKGLIRLPHRSKPFKLETFVATEADIQAAANSLKK